MPLSDANLEILQVRRQHLLERPAAAPPAVSPKPEPYPIDASQPDADPIGETPAHRLNRAIADPASIRTHAEAMEALADLDHRIADIEGQLEVARSEERFSPLTEDRKDWMRRAAYAQCIRKSQRQRVSQRDRELRGTKGPAQTPKLSDDERLLRRQQMAETLVRAADRQREIAARELKIAQLLEAADWRKRFVELSRDILGDAIHEALIRTATRAAREAPAAEPEAEPGARVDAEAVWIL